MGLALSSTTERLLPCSAVRDATASPLAHLTEAIRKDRVKPGKIQKGKKRGGGGMQEGSILS